MKLQKILPDIIKEVVKQTLESIMVAEREVFLKENGGTKNGFYVRNLDTVIGKLENLRVPRDREGKFRTKLIEPYRRRDINLEDLILGMFASGMSARAVAQALESAFELKYSPSTISQISQVTLEEINKWKQKKLKSRYSVIMLDGMWLSVRRDTVEKEVVLFVIGIDEDGYKQILDFEVNPSEGAESWAEMIKRLYDRGVREVLLFVADGITGLEERIKEYFPKADFQTCVVHKVKNTLNKVRAKDRKKVAKDLKRIYQVSTEEDALRGFEKFKEKWGAKYPKVVKSWEQELYKLLTFLRYPESIQRVVYTTNLIERTIKEIRKRVKVIGALPSVGAVEKFVYLRVAMLNDRWSNRVVNGFLEAKEEIQDMFSRRHS
ncbi:transposase mutator type [Desulfurobacterium thermolithotrophum DSM 11699]|uniref:Mutator family transposase n=1 Tax=Desulfurobacterium thermolithotrophum (strain DSM 11699 / BSA) TaxID=868864 RepID=F0S323_DESTD|nr:IS256 family transposase [Desulfurobacterium thermolithotrophum]ADY73245.1 transposase mutator type [Desulfurobacterium thermolithotrophum DSM 11699]